MINHEQHRTVHWRKSSYSGNNGDCVEVNLAADAVAVRDSKDPSGPALTFSPAAFRAFLARTATGALD